jgi:hypothetical protein
MAPRHRTQCPTKQATLDMKSETKYGPDKEFEVLSAFGMKNIFCFGM